MFGRAVSSTKGPVNLVARGGKRSSEEYEPLFVSALQLDDVFGWAVETAATVNG